MHFIRRNEEKVMVKKKFVFSISFSPCCVVLLISISYEKPSRVSFIGHEVAMQLKNKIAKFDNDSHVEINGLNFTP